MTLRDLLHVLEAIHVAASRPNGVPSVTGRWIGPSCLEEIEDARARLSARYAEDRS